MGGSQVLVQKLRRSPRCCCPGAPSRNRRPGLVGGGLREEEGRWTSVGGVGGWVGRGVGWGGAEWGGVSLLG